MIVETAGQDFRQCFAAHHQASHPSVAEWEALMRSLQTPPQGPRPANGGQSWSRSSIWTSPGRRPCPSPRAGTDEPSR